MNSPFVGFTTGGERITAKVRNDSGGSIPKGTPVTLALDGTDDGLAVILPSAAGSQAAADQFFYGILKDTLADTAIGEVQLFGVARQAIIRRATRGGSATSDNWAGSTSIAKGVLLSIDTVNNCFSTAAASQTNDSNTSITTIASRVPFAFLAESLISFASTDSVATSNGSALTILAKVFVRAL
jgi:hypothetical protein